MAKKYGTNSDAFKQAAQQQQPKQKKPEQIIPDNVGEYVDFEEVK